MGICLQVMTDYRIQQNLRCSDKTVGVLLLIAPSGEIAIRSS